MIYSLFLCFSIAGIGCNYVAGPLDTAAMCRDYKARYEQGKADDLARRHMRYVCAKKPTWQPVD